MAKAAKETTFLVSSAGTGFFYTNRKNKKKFKGEKKLSVTKYDPIARKHVKFEEKKLSRLKKRFVPAPASKKPDDAKAGSTAEA